MKADRHPFATAELALGCAATIIALALRAWDIGSSTIDHYDEGVYAFSAQGLANSSGLFPNQELFSPPLFFSLAAAVYRVFGLPPDLAAAVLNVGFGTGTVLLAWIAGRRWFGAPAGVAAAWLLALNEGHILLSRSALTDVSFTFLFLLAVVGIIDALERDSFKRAILGGLACGAAWNTKYHGWFALLVTGGFLAMHVVARKRAGGYWKRPVLLWLTSAAVATAAYLPWGIAVQLQRGGSERFVRYYLEFIGPQWLGNIRRQAAMQLYLDGVLSRLAVPVALLAAMSLTMRERRVSPLGIVMIVALTASALWIGAAGTAAWIALITTAVLLHRWRPIGGAAAAWLGLWIIAAPLYRPYFRLILPFTVISFIVAGAGIAWFGMKANTGRTSGRVSWPAAAALAVLVLAVIGVRGESDVEPWRSDASLRTLAQAVAEELPDGAPVVVIGNPAVAYYLQRTGRVVLDPWSGVPAPDSLDAAVHFIGTTRDDLVKRASGELGDRLEILRDFHIEPSDIRLLGDSLPRAARQYRNRPNAAYDLTLYRISPLANPTADRLPN